MSISYTTFSCYSPLFFLDSKGHEVKSMDRKRAKQYQTIAFVLLVIAFVCILLNVFF